MTQIVNNLDIAVDVFVEIDGKTTNRTTNRALMRDGSRVSRLEAGESLDYYPFKDDDVIGESFKVYFEMIKEPEKNGITGAKVALAKTGFPGDLARIKDLQIPHHFAYYKKGNKYYAEVHYMLDKSNLKGANKSMKDPKVQDKLKKIFRDIDPNIQHPDD